MAVFGSGGHTTEMLKMIEPFQDYSPKMYVYADQMTPKKLETLGDQNFQVSLKTVD